MNFVIDEENTTAAAEVYADMAKDQMLVFKHILRFGGPPFPYPWLHSDPIVGWDQQWPGSPLDNLPRSW